MICLLGLLPARSRLHAQDSVPTYLTYEFRAVWGGGPQRSFAGKITVTEGSLEIVRNLSVQDDAVGTLRKQSANTIELTPHSASTFGGADILVKAPAQSQIQFQWEDTGNGLPPEPISVNVGDLARRSSMFTIDSRGSRLALKRPVHDQLRVRTASGKTIFSPSDRCALLVEGYRNDLPAGEYRIQLRLLENGSGKVVGSWQQDVDIDGDGSFQQQTFNDLTVPTKAGVYAFDVALQRKRLISSFINTPATSNRRLEIVVHESAAPPDGETVWRELGQVYPAGESWYDHLGKFRIPAVKTFTPLVTHIASPIGSGDHSRRMVENVECMQLGKNAWQAFPLAVQGAGSPHRVRIKVPGDNYQELAFSIQESSSPADVSGLRLDSGVVVMPSTERGPGFVVHELVFWPRSSQPYLLVMNPDAVKDAAIAEITLDVAEQGRLQTTPIKSGDSTKPGRIVWRPCIWTSRCLQRILVRRDEPMARVVANWIVGTLVLSDASDWESMFNGPDTIRRLLPLRLKVARSIQAVC